MTLPEPVYKDEYVALYKGDCKDILWDLPLYFASAIITDPPYPIEGNKQMTWDGGREYVEDIDEHGFADGFDIRILAEAFKPKLKNINMTFFCNKAQIYGYLKWARVFKCNFQILEWHKPDCIPIGGFYLLDTEYIVHIWDKLSIKRKPMNTYFIHNVVKSEYDHPTCKPEVIVSKLIEQLTEPGDIIIEPYGGSGTTAVCAKRLGRKCIITEIKDKYVDIIKNRVAKTPANCKQASFGDM